MLIFVVKMPRYETCWNNETRYEPIASTLPIQCQEKVRVFLHVVGNTEKDKPENKGDKCFKVKQEMLCVVTIAMIGSPLAWLWKSQYFQRPINNAVEDLWWSLYCENIKPLSIYSQKSSIVDAPMGSKYTSGDSSRLFRRFIFFKDFRRPLKSVRSYYFFKVLPLLFNSSTMLNI